MDDTDLDKIIGILRSRGFTFETASTRGQTTLTFREAGVELVFDQFGRFWSVSALSMLETLFPKLTTTATLPPVPPETPGPAADAEEEPLLVPPHVDGSIE